jgi:hypothetical protein
MVAELGSKVLSPLYTAVIVCGLPANVSVAVVKNACPAPFSVAVPMEVPLSKNVTEPVGVPPPDVTVAVNVTGSP